MHRKPSRLLSLPPELRNMIFELVMGRPRVFIMHGGTSPTTIYSNSPEPLHRFYYISWVQERDHSFPILTKLYLVCRQLLQETFLLLYSAPIFDFQNNFVMEKWAESLKDTERAAVRSVVFWDEYCKHLPANLMRLPGLKDVYAVDPMDYAMLEEALFGLHVNARWLDWSYA